MRPAVNLVTISLTLEMLILTPSSGLSAAPQQKGVLDRGKEDPGNPNIRSCADGRNSPLVRYVRHIEKVSIVPKAYMSDFCFEDSLYRGGCSTQNKNRLTAPGVSLRKSLIENRFVRS